MVGTLSTDVRSRARRLAIVSHQPGMTHRRAYTDDLPTLAIVALGGSEAVVGLQRALEPLGQILQFPTLRAVGRFRKRSILIAGQVIAVLGGLPLVLFGLLEAAGPARAIPIALASLSVAAIGIVISQTVWFPLLRGYVEPERVGSFFGLLRTTWHITLVLFFLGSQQWLAANPGAFGLLFGVATAAGLLRLFLVARLPEAEAEMGSPVRIREALGLFWRDARLRRYLLGVSLGGAVRRTIVPFVIVMMRRIMGLSDADVLLTTVASLGGGLASLYLWGRAVDRFGPSPVFNVTGVGTALLCFGLLTLEGSEGVIPMVAFFFALSVLFSGFGVADTHVLFSLAPAEAPTRVFVLGAVLTSFAYGLAPLLAGFALEAALRLGVAPLPAYHALFGVAGLTVLLALAPLRTFRL
jgi:hypothetical protein